MKLYTFASLHMMQINAVIAAAAATATGTCAIIELRLHLEARLFISR